MRLDDLIAEIGTKQTACQTAVEKLREAEDTATQEADIEKDVKGWVERQKTRVRPKEITEYRDELKREWQQRRQDAAETVLAQRGILERHAAEMERESETLIPLWQRMSAQAGDYTLAMLRMSDELSLTRVEQQMPQWSPTETYAAYQRAVEVKDDVTLRAIERDWVRRSTAQHTNPSNGDINALFLLGRAVTQARQARHAPEARALRAYLASIPGVTFVQREHLRLVSQERIA